jgi:hypothetical protein
MELVMVGCCVYPAISKSLKQLSNCLKIAVTRVVLSVFKGVICDVRTTAKQLMTILKFNWKRYEKANVRKNSTKK